MLLTNLKLDLSLGGYASGQGGGGPSIEYLLDATFHRYDPGPQAVLDGEYIAAQDDALWLDPSRVAEINKGGMVAGMLASSMTLSLAGGQAVMNRNGGANPNYNSGLRETNLQSVVAGLTQSAILDATNFTHLSALRLGADNRTDSFQSWSGMFASLSDSSFVLYLDLTLNGIVSNLRLGSSLTYKPYKLSIVSGGFTSGKPDPAGVAGMMLLVDDVPVYSHETAPAKAGLYACVSLGSQNDIDAKSDDIRSYIDPTPLATPHRSLFAQDHANVENYVPEDGPAYVSLRTGTLKTLNGLLQAETGADWAIAAYDNPGGGYWEYQFKNGVDRWIGFALRVQNGDPSNRFAVVFYQNNINLYEYVADAANNKGGISATVADGESYRIIVQADDDSIKVIDPQTGSIIGPYSSTSLNTEVTVGPSLNSSLANDGIEWECARMGTVAPYVAIASQPYNYGFVVNQAGNRDYSQYFITNGATYSINKTIPGMTFNSATGILSGTPTVEADTTDVIVSADGVALDAHTVSVSTVPPFPGVPGLSAHYDISDITSLFQDSTATTPVTADGDPVGAVLDLSGNGLTLTQPDTGKHPTYRATDESLPTIRGDAADDLLSHANATLFDPPIHEFLGLRITPHTKAMTLMDGLVLNQKRTYIHAAGNNLWSYCGGSGPSISGAPIESAFGTLDSVFTVAAMKLGINGGTQNSSGSATGDPTGLSLCGVTGEPSDAWIGEYAVYNHELTSQERTDLQTYFSAKWGIT